jgi:xylulose-5-phosphate/fructose-6-phosphate phosphoketolase
MRDTYTRNTDSATFRLFCPDETNSNRLGAVFEVEDRCFVGKTLPIDKQPQLQWLDMDAADEHLARGASV